jgi:uncharacterized protein YecT (DUF1311 family)
MRVLFIGFAAFGFAAIANAQAPAHKSDGCSDAVTQAAITECFTRRAQSADSAVKQAYRHVLTGSNAKRRVLLRASQRSWISYRDAYCRFDAAQFEDGSLYASELGACLAELSNTRAEELLSDASAERETGGAAPRDP